jgi:hypothetical protein
MNRQCSDLDLVALRTDRMGTAECAGPDEQDVLPTMATDYDASRKSEEEPKEESLEALRLAATDKDTNSGKIDEDEAEAAESFELPGADLSNEELSIEVVPRQDDEFTMLPLLPRASPHRTSVGNPTRLSRLRVVRGSVTSSIARQPDRQ